LSVVDPPTHESTHYYDRQVELTTWVAESAAGDFLQ
jgi:hypothetical protein